MLRDCKCLASKSHHTDRLFDGYIERCQRLFRLDRVLSGIGIERSSRRYSPDSGAPATGRHAEWLFRKEMKSDCGLGWKAQFFSCWVSEDPRAHLVREHLLIARLTSVQVVSK